MPDSRLGQKINTNEILFGNNRWSNAENNRRSIPGIAPEELQRRSDLLRDKLAREKQELHQGACNNGQPMMQSVQETRDNGYRYSLIKILFGAEAEGPEAAKNFAKFYGIKAGELFSEEYKDKKIKRKKHKKSPKNKRKLKRSRKNE